MRAVVGFCLALVVSAAVSGCCTCTPAGNTGGFLTDEASNTARPEVPALAAAR